MVKFIIPLIIGNEAILAEGQLSQEPSIEELKNINGILVKEDFNKNDVKDLAEIRERLPQNWVKTGHRKWLAEKHKNF